MEFLPNINRKHILVAFIVMLVFAGLFIVGLLGLYPIASVNGKLIIADELNTTYRAALQYQNNLIAYYNQQNASTTITAPPDREVERSALNQLIEFKIVDTELRHEQDLEVLQTLISDKIDKYRKHDLEKQATLFGLTLDEYKSLILMPQAEHDILWNSLFVQGKDANAWLAEAKRNARVALFSLRWKWNGAEAVAR